MHAAKHRQRLGSGGNGGIPLWCELKSLVGIALDLDSGIRIPFAAHTRANTRFKEGDLLHVLGIDRDRGQILRLFEEEAGINLENDGTSGAVSEDSVQLSRREWFGKVNPFNVDQVLFGLFQRELRLDEVYQVFDSSLELDGGIPNTLMTNLGHRQYAFEVSAEDLILGVERLFPRTSIAPISEPCPIWLGLEGHHPKDYWLQFPPPSGPKIGILTGNSPESGITLWQDILTCLRRAFPNLPDTLMPEVVVESLPGMGLSMELPTRERDVRAVVLRGVKGLLASGSRLLTFACNTTIYFEPEVLYLCREQEARFVSIAEACMPAISKALGNRDGCRVGLVGIGPVVDMDSGYSGYKRRLESEGLQIAPCPADDLAFALKSKGDPQKLVAGFRKLISGGLPAEDFVVILALTEMSIVYRQHIANTPANKRSGRLFVDPLLELAAYLSLLYLEQGYRESAVCQIPAEFEIRSKLFGKVGHA